MRLQSNEAVAEGGCSQEKGWSTMRPWSGNEAVVERGHGRRRPQLRKIPQQKEAAVEKDSAVDKEATVESEAKVKRGRG